MYKSRKIPVLVLLMGLALISGCSTQPSVPPAVKEEPGYPVTIHDDLGRRVSIAREPQRIVSLSQQYRDSLRSRIGVTD